MQAGPSPGAQARSCHRHELRTLVYVTLDQANGGIVRNLTQDGIAVQAVAAVPPRQQLRVRFELRYPRLRVETRGEVMWSTFSGQCGIRFLDLTPPLRRQIDEWIFGDLLEGGLAWGHAGGVLVGADSASVAASAAAAIDRASARTAEALAKVEDDGLIVSPADVKVIELPTVGPAPIFKREVATASGAPLPGELDWLSQPLSARGLAWTVNGLIVIASLFLCIFVFLSVVREAPRWPVTMTSAAAVVVAGLYWGFFKIFGGTSFGTRLARLAADSEEGKDLADARFR